MSTQKHKRDKSRYCRRLGPIGGRSYEINVESGKTYLAVPCEDIEKLGLMPGWNPMAFLSRESRRSWAGEVVYLDEKDTSAFCEVYCKSVGHMPDMHRKSNGARSLISRLPFIYEPVKKDPDPVLPTAIPFPCGDDVSDCRAMAIYNPIIQSITDFVMYVMVHDLVDNHPVQGPRMLNTSLKLLRTWVRSKTPALRGTFYDDRTRLMWAYTLRTEFPVCQTCHKEFGRIRNIHLSKTYSAYQTHCSMRCAYHDVYVRKAREETSMERYGSRCAASSDEVRGRILKTVRQKYGADSVFKNPEVSIKIRKTCLERFGVEHPLQNRSILAKTADTLMRLHGVDSSMKIPEVRAKARKTLQDRYGVDSPLQDPGIRAKAEATRMERYGVAYPAQDAVTMDRIIEKRIRNRRLENRPTADGLVFDSGWELEFYLFCKSKGLDIEYHPCCFEYSYGGKTHRYYPDFKVGSRLYEVKGDCFINKDGTWRSPFRRDGSSDAEYSAECDQMEAKRQCLVSNGVIVVSSNEMKNLEEIVCA